MSSTNKSQRKTSETLPDTVAQVHKATPPSSAPRDDDVEARDHRQRLTSSARDEGGSETSSAGSNRTYIMEDNRRENYNSITQTPSVDEETQIATKIVHLIESEMKRDINKTSHFSDSRPQSLSFYEEEKLPEELSGNLELLSPEERKHYKRRKEHVMDNDERNMYNSISDVYNRDSDEITMKKSKSRKKKHTIESELGDSREMMIPITKEKKKSKRKKHESTTSPTTKRKHRNKNPRDLDDTTNPNLEQQQLQMAPRTEITIALDDLQDDVFESGSISAGLNNHYQQQGNSSSGLGQELVHVHQNQQQGTGEFCGKHTSGAGGEKSKRSPRRTDKVYVQKKHRFEMTLPAKEYTECPICKGTVKHKGIFAPLNFALTVQEVWHNFARLCHGILGGLALAHFIYVKINYSNERNEELFVYSANYNQIYMWVFYMLCAICIISVMDRYDFAHLNCSHCVDLLYSKKSSILILIYLVIMIIHLLNVEMDENVDMLLFDKNRSDASKQSVAKKIFNWYVLSLIRGILATVAWIIISFTSNDDMLLIHLKNMQKYQLN